MSKYRQESIECPHCGAEGSVRLWDSVNVDVDSSLREKVMSDELFEWKCPQCGTEVYIPFGTLYHDMKHQFMILYQFDEPGDDDYRNGVETPDLFGLGNYSLRTVYGPHNLKEKILIFEAGLNDVAIERLKYGLAHFHNIGIGQSPLYFIGINCEDTEKSDYGSMGFLIHNEEGGKDQVISVPMDAYYEQKLAVEIDPRMHVTDWACVDQKWIGSHLKTSKL